MDISLVIHILQLRQSGLFLSQLPALSERPFLSASHPRGDHPLCGYPILPLTWWQLTAFSPTRPNNHSTRYTQTTILLTFLFLKLHFHGASAAIISGPPLLSFPFCNISWNSTYGTAGGKDSKLTIIFFEKRFSSFFAKCIWPTNKKPKNPTPLKTI